MVQTVAGGAFNDPGANDDDQDAVQFSNSGAPVSGYSIKYIQSPCTGPSQS